MQINSFAAAIVDLSSTFIIITQILDWSSKSVNIDKVMIMIGRLYNNFWREKRLPWRGSNVSIKSSKLGCNGPKLGCMKSAKLAPLAEKQNKRIYLFDNSLYSDNYIVLAVH